MIDVLALDVDATLISNVFSMIPRPYLYDFLEYCFRKIPRVVIFTAASPHSARYALQRLEKDGKAPPGTGSLPMVEWSGEKKNLQFVQRMYPRVPLHRIFIVDDMIQFIMPTQYDQWLPIRPYVSSSSIVDTEFLRIMARIDDMFDREIIEKEKTKIHQGISKGKK